MWLAIGVIFLYMVLKSNDKLDYHDDYSEENPFEDIPDEGYDYGKDLFIDWEIDYNDY